MKLREVKFDCIHFRGDIPCAPNKKSGEVCPTCKEYKAIKTKILIIKLGALGDVIRSTPLITRFRKKYPNAHITWVTHSPAILPADKIDKIYKFDFNSVYHITHQQYDVAINLDKEMEACSLLADVNAKEKFGFIWKNNHIDIANENAEHKLMTGLFDSLSIKNQKNYLEEIFEICGFDFQKEPYLLNYNEELAEDWKLLREKAGNKIIVGLNTGCGKRWSTRLWPSDYWIELIVDLQKANYFPVLLGGEDEDSMNKLYHDKTGAYYPGTFSLEEFIALTSNCDIIVTAVSMMMHIAIGLKKPMLLFNNIFNKHEFELYGKGIIVEPHSGCDCYYGNSCKRSKNCMQDISVEKVFSTVGELSKMLK